MRMSRLVDSSVGDFESRKRALQRREMGQVYRKNAQYQSSKSPLLQALENLLVGKTERELLQADLAEREQSSAEKQAVPALIADGYGRALPGETSPQEGKQFIGEEAVHFAELDDQIERRGQFMGSFSERDAALGTLLPGRQIESQAYERLFQLASTNYLNHIAMVKNGYHSFDEPTFSKTA